MTTVYDQIVATYDLYKDELKHDWSITGFVLNPNLIEISSRYDDKGDLSDACERIARKIYHSEEDVDGQV